MTEGEVGREGGKVSKVLPAHGAQRLMLVERRWLETEGAGKLRMCMSVWKEEWRGANCKHHATASAAANHPCTE